MVENAKELGQRVPGSAENCMPGTFGGVKSEKRLGKQ